METTLPPKYSLVLNMFFFSKLLMMLLNRRYEDGACGAAHRHSDPASQGEPDGHLPGVPGHVRHCGADGRPGEESRHRIQRSAWVGPSPGFFANGDRCLSASHPAGPRW